MQERSSMLGRFIRQQEGAAMVEYGLLVGLLSIVVIATVATAAKFVNGAFVKAHTDMAANGFTSE